MGSENKDKNVNGNGGGSQGIPSMTEKVVQNLKEIVNYPEQEIYAMLKECDMDPNHAVERLLSQDTFHEVKSKRERRKEMKETQDSRSRSNTTSLSRGGNAGSEQNIVQTAPTNVSYEELGKAANKGEIGSFCPSVSSSTNCVVGKNTNALQSKSDSVSIDCGRQSIVTDYSISASVQPSPGHQPTWSGLTKEHLSMADIVRMGRSNKGSQTSTETSYASHDAASHYRTMNQNHSGQCVFHDEWPVDEKPNVSFISNAFIASDADVISDVSNLHDSKLLANDDSEAVQMSEGDSGNNNSDNIGSDFISSRHTIVNNDGRALYSNNDLKDSCYDSHRCAYVQDEANGAQLSHSNHLEHLTGNAVVDVSSADGNFDQLSLRNSNLEVPQTEDNLTVVLPDHLQALAADCSHLSFGTYNSGSNPASSVPPATNPFRNDLDETERALDHSSGFLDASNSVYRGDEQLGSMYDTVRREISGDKNYDFLASSKLDMLKQIIPEATLEHEYITSSVPDTSFERIQWPAPTVPFLRSEWESRNLPTFPSETVAGSDFVHVGILASKMKALRDSDFLQSSSVIKQSLPSRYSNSVSTTSNPTISMPEVIRPGTYSLPQRSSALNQHLRVQPTLPCEQSSISAAMGYLSLSQNHAYKPSGTLQQAYSDTSAYDQSLAGMKYGLPMNRSEVSMNRLPLSAKESSVYGNFGTPTYSPGNFLHSSTAPTIASNGYDEALHTQYRVGSSFSSSQQNRGFPIMDYGPGSRTLPSVPESTYYSLLGQSQGHIEYQRGQLQSNYGVPIYPDLHHSQTAMAAEHQLQSGPQDHSSKQSHHLWHRSY